jgi:hypothetical protein
MDMPVLLPDGDFDLIYDRLPTSFVAGVEARLAQADAPICAYEFLARSIPAYVQQQLMGAFEEAEMHRILTLWASQAILETGVIVGALKQADMR